MFLSQVSSRLFCRSAPAPCTGISSLSSATATWRSLSWWASQPCSRQTCSLDSFGAPSTSHGCCSSVIGVCIVSPRFVIPCGMVVCNDTFAYFAGFFFGKTVNCCVFPPLAVLNVVMPACVCVFLISRSSSCHRRRLGRASSAASSRPSFGPFGSVFSVFTCPCSARPSRVRCPAVHTPAANTCGFRLLHLPAQGPRTGCFFLLCPRCSMSSFCTHAELLLGHTAVRSHGSVRPPTTVNICA